MSFGEMALYGGAAVIILGGITLAFRWNKSQRQTTIGNSTGVQSGRDTNYNAGRDLNQK